MERVPTIISKNLFAAENVTKLIFTKSLTISNIISLVPQQKTKYMKTKAFAYYQRYITQLVTVNV